VSLASDLADVLGEAGCDASTVDHLDGRAWHTALQLVQVRRGRRPSHHYIVPSDSTQAAATAILRRARP
jgi:hypothetical protein